MLNTLLLDPRAISCQPVGSKYDCHILFELLLFVLFSIVDTACTCSISYNRTKPQYLFLSRIFRALFGRLEPADRITPQRVRWRHSWQVEGAELLNTLLTLKPNHTNNFSLLHTQVIRKACKHKRFSTTFSYIIEIIATIVVVIAQGLRAATTV